MTSNWSSAVGTRYQTGGDVCLTLWAAVYDTRGIKFPPHARVLEIGCAEADWIGPMLALRPDLAITGIDWRARPLHPKATILQGDVLTVDFPPASVDAIVGISSIEHIGLGHYAHDPLDPDGDRHVMQKVVQWLKPGGWVYLDVPYDPTQYYVKGTKCRVYDDRALRERLIVPGLTERGRWFASFKDTSRFIPPPVTAPQTLFDYVALWAVKDV